MTVLDIFLYVSMIVCVAYLVIATTIEIVEAFNGKIGGNMKSRRYLESELREALSNIRYQMDYGYLDIGVHDQLEMAIVKRAVDEWEAKYLNRKKYRGWCET